MFALFSALRSCAEAKTLNSRGHCGRSPQVQQFITAAQQAYDAPRKQSLSVGHNDHIVLGPVGPARSLQVQEQNRQTWDLFLRSVTHELGPVKVREICQRYQFDVVKMYRQGAPLLPKHIEIFSVGASRIATKDLKRRLDQSRLRDLSVEQSPSAYTPLIPFPLWAGRSILARFLGIRHIPPPISFVILSGWKMKRNCSFPMWEIYLFPRLARAPLQSRFEPGAFRKANHPRSWSKWSDRVLRSSIARLQQEMGLSPMRYLLWDLIRRSNPFWSLDPLKDVCATKMDWKPT